MDGFERINRPLLKERFSSGTILYKLPGTLPTRPRLEVSADGRFAIVDVEDPYARLIVLDLINQRAIFRIPIVRFGACVPLRPVFSPDSTQLVVGGKDVQVWDLINGRLLHELPHDDGVVSADFSRDGRQLVTVAGSRHWNTICAMRIWDVRNGRLVQTIKCDNAAGAAIVPDGKSIISWAVPSFVDLRSWDIATGELKSNIAPILDSPGGPVRLFPEGPRCLGRLTGNVPYLVLVDLASGRIVRRFRVKEDILGEPAWSSNGKFAAFLDSASDIHVFDVANWKHLRILKKGSIPGHSAARPTPQDKLAVLPDGASVLSVGRDLLVRRWDVVKVGQ